VPAGWRAWRPPFPVRQLKQRAIGEVRRVPCPPVLTGSIRWHITRFGLGPGGRLFGGERNKAELPVLTINRIWRQARAAVLTPELYASPLAETPYDLRHAAVSTWLNAGISPTQVAEWAGQSPEVLWRNCAKCLAGGEAELRRRLEAGYGGQRATPNLGTYSAQILVEGRQVDDDGLLRDPSDHDDRLAVGVRVLLAMRHERRHVDVVARVRFPDVSPQRRPRRRTRTPSGR
jgi:hypothetical protein